jgi:hypothetical protein
MTTHLPNLCRGEESLVLYIHSPIRLHGIVLSQLSKGTTLLRIISMTEEGQLNRYCYGLRTGPSGFDARQGQYFSLLLSVQRSSVAHPASIQWAPGRLPRG